MSPRMVNLGCGARPQPGWINADLIAGPGVDLVLDLRRPLPFPDDSVDVFQMAHVLEHVPAPLELMAELWRVARPGGQLHLALPHGAHDRAWADPTHVRPYFLSSLHYFGQPMHESFDYGYRADWAVELVRYGVPTAGNEARADAEILQRIDELRNQVLEMSARLVAVKPPRPRRMQLQAQPRVQILRMAARAAPA